MYILTEHVMNGTVTIQTAVTLVDAPDFQSAKNKLRKIFEEKECLSVTISLDDDEVFQFSAKGGALPFWGRMENKQPVVI